MKKIIILIIFLFTCTSIFSQSINMFDIDTSAFPIMKAKFFAFDKDGNLQRPNSSELKISENGINRTITNVTCSSTKPLQTVSLTMSIDISGSMAYSDFNEVPVELGKLTATELCKLIVMPPSEFALQTCHATSTLIQDFTSSRSKILKAIPPIKAGGGNDFVEHLLNKLTGLLNIAKKGKEKKVAVLYTDAWWYALAPNELQACLDTCKKYKIEFYTVIYSRKEAEPNGIKASLRELCSKSGGYFYDGVTSTEAAKSIANNIQKVVQGAEPCEMTWESDVSCTANINTFVELSWQGQKSTFEYTILSSSIRELIVKPNFLAFGKRLPSTLNDTTITLTAKNADLNITGISRKFGSTDFSVVNTTFPINIPQNTSKNITVSFVPSDSSLKYASFEIETDRCNAYFSANGGFLEKKSTTSTLKLTHPNGGESFVLGSDTLITWTGVSPTDTVSLEYSFDNGTNWKVISQQATGLKYNWKNIPKPTSSNCLVRINHGGKIADTNSIITLVGHNDFVWCIAFSPDGSQVATGSYKKVMIWDVKTGVMIKTLIGHKDDIYGISYSPDGSRLATASRDSTAKIWDVKNGIEFRTLNGHKSSLWDITYSPDGSQVVTAGYDYTAKIWDVNTGLLLKTLIGHNRWVRSITYSHDGSRIATASDDNTAKIWDAKTGALIINLTGQISGYGISFSPDDSKLAITCYNNNITVWDVTTGSLIRTLYGHTDKISDVTYSPDGSQIATSSIDRTAKIWDVTTGSLIRTLYGHTDDVINLTFNPDGDRIATCSWDGTAKIWDVDKASNHHDISDVNFAIVAPIPRSHDIDMRQCLVGTSRDSLVSTFVQNKGTYPFRVDSIAIIDKDANQFMIVSGIPPFTVPANDSRAVEIRFKPNSVGIKTSLLVIYTQANILYQNIQGEGVSPSLSIINNFIDFGIVKVNSKKDSLGVFTIKNIGSAPLKIDSITQGGPNSEDFSTLSASRTFTLAKDESAKLDLRFSPLEKGRTSGSVLFHYNGVGSPAQVQLFGNGISGIARATIQSDTIAAYPGEIIQIPIYLKDVEDLEYSSTTNFKVNLTFNATLLEPIGNTPTGILNNDNTRTIELDLPTKADEHGVLRFFKFKVGLGNDSTTKLILHKPSADAGDVDLQVESGVFNLLGICRAAGPRLINPNGEVKLSLIRPNPVGDNGELDIETIENGQTELYIVNLKGEKVATLYQGELAAGKQTLILSTKDLSNGTYFVILQTPTVTQKVKMEVVK